MKPEEFAAEIESIKRITPMPGELIVVRVTDANISPLKFTGVAAMFNNLFPAGQKVIIVDSKLDLSTIFGKCLKCGHTINPEGIRK